MFVFNLQKIYFYFFKKCILQSNVFSTIHMKISINAFDSFGKSSKCKFLEIKNKKLIKFKIVVQCLLYIYTSEVVTHS